MTDLEFLKAGMIDAYKITPAVARENEISARVTTALEDDIPLCTVLDTVVSAMDIVGEKFKKNEIYIPKVLVSAHAMKVAMEILEPVLVRAGVDPVGKSLIGTVQGDLHDIGKNF